MAATLSLTVRAGRLLRLLGWITLVLGLVLAFLFPSRQPTRLLTALPSAEVLVIFGAYGVACVIVGGALIKHTPWAKVAGTGLSIVSLPYFPFGTVLGLAALVYLVRGWREIPEI